MKDRKKLIFIMLGFGIVLILIGQSYSLFSKRIVGYQNNDLIVGDIYMKYNGSNVITGSNLKPMSKDEALERTDNIFEFTITGKNQSSKDLYYGITIENNSTFNDEDIVIYLEEVVGLNENQKILVNGLRFKDLSNHVYVNYIEKGTNTEITKTYQLRVWLREGIIVSDTEDDADYTTEEWENASLSLKVKVDGELNKMNVPLMVDSNNYSSNNKQYILASIKNYENPDEEDELLSTDDTMRLEVTGQNTLFSYRDSKGNVVETDSNSLDLTYLFNKKTGVEVQIFLKPANDTNTNTDITVKLTKNGTEVYEIIHNINLIGGNFCLNNGFNSLHDCILVSEVQSRSVNDAKTYISNKGSVNLNDTAPHYDYVEETTENQSFTGVEGYEWYFGEKYAFDSSKGTFTLKQSDGITDSITPVPLSNDAIGKYTCGTTRNSYTNCSTIYKIESVDLLSLSITGKKLTYKIAAALRSEEGLYKTSDLQGDTYFYRGNVTNNNVYFGGYYWKIIRINGDNSIRLIFNGNTTGLGIDNSAIANNANGYGATYSFNQSFGGPTYTGYMYNDEASSWESPATNHIGFAIGIKYYWSTLNDFEELEDEYGTYYRLKENNSAVTKTLAEMADDATQLASTPYTCKVTALTSTCRVLLKVNSVTIGVNSTITSSTNYYTRHPNTSDLSIVNQNNRNSTIKNQLETWYVNKFMNNNNNGKLASTYIVDNTFCNDRSITRTDGLNSGYLLTTHTYFAPRTRLLDNESKSVTLMCSNQNDRFSKTSEYGNAALAYPIGLITADEVALAGGKYNEKNENFYLRTDGNFWTMTPSSYSSTYGSAYVWRVGTTGIMGNDRVAYGNGARAVINLKSDTEILSGDGSLENPFTIK